MMGAKECFPYEKILNRLELFSEKEGTENDLKRCKIMNGLEKVTGE